MADRIDHIESSISDLISTDLYDQPVPITTSPAKPPNMRRSSTKSGRSSTGGIRRLDVEGEGEGDGGSAGSAMGDESLLMAKPMKGMDEGSPGSSV